MKNRSGFILAVLVLFGFLYVYRATSIGTADASANQAIAETQSEEEPFTVESGHIEVPRDHADRKAGEFKLYYELYSSPESRNRPLIALHGGPGNPIPIRMILSKSPLGEALLANYKILYFDQRGAGKSNVDLSAEHIRSHIHQFHMKQYIGDIETLRRTFFGEEEKITIIGSSWGGYLGLGYAIEHQEKLEGLILGSFEATAESTTSFCRNFDSALFLAQEEDPDLKRSVAAAGEAIREKKIVWNKGKENQYALEFHNLLDILSPFMFKAKYRQAKAILDGIVAKDVEAIAYLDGLDDLGSEYSVSMGGSTIGEATYCENLIDYDMLKYKTAAPDPCCYCNDEEFAKAFLRHCRAYTAGPDPFHAEEHLSRIEVPALLFAGRLDPVVPWQATARTAYKMKNATFVLIEKGAHTPFKAGGSCLAGIISQFARDPGEVDLSCLRSE